KPPRAKSSETPSHELPETISEQFGVSLATTYRDLEFSHDAKIKSAKTASNPKGAGRPRGKRAGNEEGEKSLEQLLAELRVAQRNGIDWDRLDARRRALLQARDGGAIDAVGAGD